MAANLEFIALGSFSVGVVHDPDSQPKHSLLNPVEQNDLVVSNERVGDGRLGYVNHRSPQVNNMELPVPSG